MKNVWCFYHPQSRRLVSGLDLIEASAFCLALSFDEKATWFAWRSGWSKWHVLTQVTELKRNESMVDEDTIHYPALPGSQDSDGGLAPTPEPGAVHLSLVDALVEALPDGPDLAIEETDHEFLPRAHSRHEKRFRVELEWQDKQLTTHSQDISIGGILLVKSLPEEWFGYLTVKVVDEKSGAFFVRSGSIVENQSANNRLRVEFVPFESREEEKEFETWLEAA